MNLEDILLVKVELLCNGIYFTPEFLQSANRQQITLPIPRKGGAGPAGGVYFRFSNGSVVNAMAFTQSHPDISLIATELNKQYEISYINSGIIVKNVVPLVLLPSPKYYSQTSSDGIPFKKIALIHGDRTLASTINQRCMYWRGHQQCQFCAIELSLNEGLTIEKKTGSQLIDAIHAAKNENKLFAEHLTLTLGTSPSPDKGMAEYIDAVKSIKNEYPNLPIHIQIEPMKDLSWYDRVKTAGVDTIGIHIEILDDKIREQVCPGKSLISKETYFAHWKHAVKVFGKNQVNSFILMGFEPIDSHFLQELEKVVKIGVIPEITPVRAIPSLAKKIPSTTSQELLKITKYAAQLCKKYGLDPTQNKSGCIRCEGCSALIDAFRLV